MAIITNWHRNFDKMQIIFKAITGSFRTCGDETIWAGHSKRRERGNEKREMGNEEMGKRKVHCISLSILLMF